ncbi:CFEM domain-containing protein [Seiridium cupressi]
MWFSLNFLLLLAAFAGLGVAADGSSSALNTALAELPPCALKCLLTAASTSACVPTDTACQCADAAFVASAELCVVTSCTIEESLSAKNTTQTMCGAPIRNKTVEYNVVSTTLMAIACLFVLVRLGYRKFFTSTDLGLDDWFIFLTLINCVPSAVINVSMLSANGLGRDIWTLTPDQITNFALGFWIITLLYFSEVFVLKLALLFFYLRIFPGKNMRRIILGTVAFDILFGLGFIVTALLQCRPISYNWTNWRGEGGGQCINISAVAWANAAVSISLDLFMLAIPLSQLRELNLHWKKKVGVALMFCVGTFVTVVSIIRLASLVEFRESTNLTWDYWGVSLWSTVEITVGIICACMPSMRLILVRIAPKVFDGSLVRNSRYYYARRSKSIAPFEAGKWAAHSKSSQPTDTDVSNPKSAASRNSWVPPHVRRSWRVSRSNQDHRIMADGILFSKVTPDQPVEEDQGRLVAMETLDPNKYKTEITISGGAQDYSRGSTPEPHSPGPGSAKAL